MKTLTAKLAVAALLVAGAHVNAATDAAHVVISTLCGGTNVINAAQDIATTWNSANKNATRIQRAKSAVRNYGLPVAKIAANAALFARANDLCTCAYVPKVNKDAALGGLVALALVDYAWKNRTQAQVAADAAVVTAVETETSAAQAAANAQAAAAQSASTDSKAKAAVSKK